MHLLRCTALLLLASCQPDAPVVDPDAGTKGAKTSGLVDRAEIAPGERLMYLPEGDPGALLGRAVERNEDGQLIIAAERRPGCIVKVAKVGNEYHRTYQSVLKDVAAVQASVQSIAQLEGHYEGELSLRLDIRNDHVLRGDLQGECGDHVITEVKVGRGERQVLHAQAGGGEVAVDLGPAGGGGAQGEHSKSEQETLSWETPQAWAFKVSGGDNAGAAVEVVMPEALTAGEKMQARVQVNRPVFLVVLYRDAEGHHGVLLPRGAHKAAYAAGEDVALPEMMPSNLPGHTEDRETLVVYAFPEEADFKQFKPPAGAIDTARADAYAADLDEQLKGGAIPAKRWSYTEFTYVITAPSP